MAEDTTLNGVINLNETGLSASTKAEISNDLDNIIREAYGSDFSIAEGNPTYIAKNLFADCLADVAGTCLKLYGIIGINNCTDQVLDNAVSYGGIVRNAQKNSSVIMKVGMRSIATISIVPSGNLKTTYTIPRNTKFIGTKSSVNYIFLATDDIVIPEPSYVFTDYTSTQTYNLNSYVYYNSLYYRVAQTVPIYSSIAYSVGALCVYNDRYYKCTIAISTGEAFNTGKWSVITTPVGNTSLFEVVSSPFQTISADIISYDVGSEPTNISVFTCPELATIISNITTTKNSQFISSTFKDDIVVSSQTTISDVNSNSWKSIVNTSFPYNSYEYITFESITDKHPYNTYIGANNNNTYEDWISTTASEEVSFINLDNSSYGIAQETDAHLRYRYQTSLYSASKGTSDGIISKILALNATDANPDIQQIDSCIIIENVDVNLPSSGINYNNWDTYRYGIPIHHICVIFDTVGHSGSTWNGTGTYSTDITDNAVANIIKDYKTLGCGTSYAFYEGTTPPYNSTTKNGGILCKVIRNDISYDIKLVRATNVNCAINIVLIAGPSMNVILSTVEVASIIELIKENIVKYIQSLTLGTSVLYQTIANCINDVAVDSGYTNFTFDIASLGIGVKVTSGNQTYASRVEIKPWEYAYITEEDIKITWSTT